MRRTSGGAARRVHTAPHAACAASPPTAQLLPQQNECVCYRPGDAPGTPSRRTRVRARRATRRARGCAARPGRACTWPCQRASPAAAVEAAAGTARAHGEKPTRQQRAEEREQTHQADVQNMSPTRHAATALCDVMITVVSREQNVPSWNSYESFGKLRCVWWCVWRLIQLIGTAHLCSADCPDQQRNRDNTPHDVDGSRVCASNQRTLVQRRVPLLGDH